MNWTNAETTDELMYYQLQLQTPLTLSETQNQAEDDTIFWAMPKVCLYILSSAVSLILHGVDARTDIYDRYRC